MLQRQRAGLATQLDVLAAQKPLLQLDQQLGECLAQRGRLVAGQRFRRGPLQAVEFGLQQLVEAG